jgi:serine/threonine-protein kinase
LAELRRERGRLPTHVAVRILLDALSGLAALHHVKVGGRPAGFVHGEVTPSNIIVGPDGIGRLVPLVPSHWDDTAPPSADATGYTAPERLLGDTYDQRADVFSAGVLLWEALVGKPLFADLPVDAVVTQLIGGKVPYPAPVDAPPWQTALADAAILALAVDPTERWPHVGVLGAEIEAASEGFVAPSYEVAALVTGRSAGEHDARSPSTSSPPSSSSLTPLASSIRSSSPGELRFFGPSVYERGEWTEENDASFGALLDSRTSRPMVARKAARRRLIVASAAGAILALIVIIGYEVLTRRPVSTASSTVLAPVAAEPVAAPLPVGVAPPSTPPAQPQPAVAVSPPATAGKVSPSPPANKANAKASPGRATPKTKSSSTTPASTSAVPAPSTSAKKHNDDPFGINAPVRAKPDPFGI